MGVVLHNFFSAIFPKKNRYGVMKLLFSIREKFYKWIILFHKSNSEPFYMTETVYAPPLDHASKLHLRLQPEPKRLWHLLIAVVLLSNIAQERPSPLRELDINGKDGGIVIARKGTIVNTYAELISSVEEGDQHLSLSSYCWQQGDLLLILQMENSARSISSRFEFAKVKSAVCGEVTLEREVRDSYSHLHTQIVKIPQYHTLRLKAGAELQPAPWNGKTGGVIAIAADSLITVSRGARINASGLGKAYGGGLVFLLTPRMRGKGEIDASGLFSPRIPYSLSDDVQFPTDAGRVEVWGERVDEVNIFVRGKGNGIISLPGPSLAACVGNGTDIYQQSASIPYGHASY